MNTSPVLPHRYWPHRCWPIAGLLTGTLLLAACSQQGPQSVDTLHLHNVVTVTTTADSGPGSLRDAIASAFPGDQIAFAPELEGQTIHLTSGQLILNKTLTLSAPGDGIAISGSDSYRVFTVVGGTTVRLENLTLTHGNAFGSGNTPSLAWGGAIWNFGELTIVDSMVTESEADYGGGIFNDGTLTLLRSTVAYNDALKSGGGISNNGALNIGRVSLINATVSSNRARDNGGGGISSTEGQLELLHSTVAFNSARFFGGIENNQPTSDGGSTLAIHNSIVAGNVDSNGSVDVGQTQPYGAVSASHSLIGSVGEHVAALDASNLLAVDPLLGALSPNGGANPTHALLEGSPAVDRADSGLCAAVSVAGVDQRGVARPQGEACDMGAFEMMAVATPAPVVDSLTIDEAGTVGKDAGTAVLSGSATCSISGEITLQVDLSQEQRQRRLRTTVNGSGTATIQCDGVTSWAVSVTGTNGVFVNGRVQVTARTLDAVPVTTHSQEGFLFWSKK